MNCVASGGGGRITLPVSHRFSTVRIAVLIVVLDGARVVEVGSHQELMAAAGQYAELYEIQATRRGHGSLEFWSRLVVVDGNHRTAWSHGR